MRTKSNRTRLTIRQALIAIAGGLIVLLVVLLFEDILLLNKLQATLERDTELALAAQTSSDILSNTTEAISYLREVALTGNLDNEGSAHALIYTAQLKLNILAPEIGADVLATLNTQLGELGPQGVQMAKAYLLDGREAGNRILYQPDTGFEARTQALLAELAQIAYRLQDLSRSNAEALAAAGSQARTLLIGTTGVLLILVPIALYLLYRKLIGTIDHMIHVVEKITAGDYGARCRLGEGDELQVLAAAFDTLLDERVEQLARIEQENDSLNSSIIRILEATGELADRDLRVDIPVTDDVTGAISDSINAAVSDISIVLQEVRQIALQVTESSASVDEQANTVYRAADNSLSVLERTLEQLDQASSSMAQVVSLAGHCQDVAADATRSTQDGLTSVLGMTEGMSRIREAIQETSKRIKRLGDRSQEISGIVGIIKDITERTHVLALNARIQASTAGEAGRGFSVVAEEVKALADSSRKATDQIASLIHNIQLETNDTIATMEKTVAEVVSGAERSETAGQQMVATQETTNTLAEVVREIAGSSEHQAQLTEAITKSAGALKARSLETQGEIERQREQTTNLADYAERLTRSVSQFKLPEAS